jgi:phosphopantothenoylcysteine decarboxylase/phosphopantothenate--cysteine ligase
LDYEKEKKGKMMNIFQEKRIVLGVTGSIAAYKTISLASSLTKKGAVVDTLLTESAEKLVTPLSFSAVTGRAAKTDQDLWQVQNHVLHIELGENNDAFLIAPATATTIAKLAYGIADNLVTLTALASRTPILVAPAMDGGMYMNSATQKNLEILEERGVQILGPASGHLASGLKGKGRMLESGDLMGHLRKFLGREGKLKGLKVMVTAGGTREDIDPVRMITNRSSGKQGYALAQAAVDHGADVLLISTKNQLPTPVGVDFISVHSAQDMQEAVRDNLAEVDILVMAAAVADYRPEVTSTEKMKKSDQKSINLHLIRTPDILKSVAEMRENGETDLKLVVGFAAESKDLIENAQVKIQKKNLDLIAVNDITRKDAGFEVDTNQVTLIWKNGKSKAYPLQTKYDVAQLILNEAADLL